MCVYSKKRKKKPGEGEATGVRERSTAPDSVNNSKLQKVDNTNTDRKMCFTP